MDSIQCCQIKFATASVHLCFKMSGQGKGMGVFGGGGDRMSTWPSCLIQRHYLTRAALFPQGLDQDTAEWKCQSAHLAEAQVHKHGRSDPTPSLSEVSDSAIKQMACSKTTWTH